MRNCIGTFTIALKSKTDTAGAQRTAGEITLHLRLIGAEVGEREKETAENAGPEGVALGRDRSRNRPPGVFPFCRADESALVNDKSVGKRCTAMPKASAIPTRMTMI